VTIIEQEAPPTLFSPGSRGQIRQMNLPLSRQRQQAHQNSEDIVWPAQATH
jgi:hypothetical protein